MGEVLQFKKKSAPNNQIPKFLEQLELLKALYLSGEIVRILVIADGNGVKCCTGNGINIRTALEMAHDFIENWKEYKD